MGQNISSTKTNNSFDKYCENYLEQWEVRATIRHLPRTRLTKENTHYDLYPSNQQLIISHPEIISLGNEVRHRILARQLANFMLDVAILEVDLISKLCIDFACDGAGITVPETAQRVALTVVTDESYHAFVAREFLKDLKEYTGVEPYNESISPLLIALDEIRKCSPKNLRRAAETMVLCFTENFVTEELFDLSAGAASKNPFHTLLREHMMDEGRHQIFFQRLMRHIWISLEEDQKCELGKLIPLFLDVFLANNNFEISQVSILDYLGCDAVTSQRIVHETIIQTFGTEILQKNKLGFMKNFLNLIEVSGILEHPPTHQYMIECGWVDASL